MTGDIILRYLMDKSYDIDYIEEYNKYQFGASLQKGLKKIVIDIDGIITILNPNLDYENSQPNLSNIAVINKLFDAGNNIFLFTARVYKTKIDWRETNENQLKRWGFKHHVLIFGKPDADYIDNKFIHIHLIEKIL
jgi:hypothetical protein